MRTVALAVISDRPRDLYLDRCLASLAEHVAYPFAQTIVLQDEQHRFTASGAVNQAWAQADDSVEFIWHAEEDFTYNGPVDLDPMMRVLDADHRLAHLVLKRQPWNGDEIAAGGIIEQWPHDVTDRITGGHAWVEHTKFFSLNPCLVPRRVFEFGFPEGSEPAMTQALLDRGYYFGYWGHRSDPPRVTHIGELRSVGSVR